MVKVPAELIPCRRWVAYKNALLPQGSQRLHTVVIVYRTSSKIKYFYITSQVEKAKMRYKYDTSALELFLKRVAFKDNYTIGKLKFSGHDEHNNVVEDNKLLCDTLEPSKISQMLIPTGKYKVIVDHSNRFNRDLPLLLNVAGFTGVRIHIGNTAKDIARLHTSRKE
ncbi:MAG: DUF5675 family protein [Endomicrobium sp.]|uniref:DUF5675 family protein n=1 Tax=Candidatus Endomicrobiellum pyrsonymphae TaxID=1408203 RepID=UPI003574FF08|nr:DUF5675 family protein [Endomicrobium sp.]